MIKRKWKTLEELSPYDYSKKSILDNRTYPKKLNEGGTRWADSSRKRNKNASSTGAQ